MSTLQTPETDDQRKARHLAMLRELGEHAMALARSAAFDAQHGPDRDHPRPTSADPHRAFTQHARTVRQIIELEQRVANPPQPRATGAAAEPPRPASNDPRAPLLRSVLYRAVKNIPAATKLRRAIDQRIDAELAADPEDNISVCDVLIAIANHLEIHIEVAKLPDEIVFAKNGNRTP